MIIKILGTGCAKCKQLESNAREALNASGVTGTIEKVTTMGDILSYGVMITPALVIDDEVKASGKVVTKEEILHLIQSI
ncbi:MAG: thioredoxin family protein [Sphaerochaeta sp.]